MEDAELRVVDDVDDVRFVFEVDVELLAGGRVLEIEVEVLEGVDELVLDDEDEDVELVFKVDDETVELVLELDINDVELALEAVGVVVDTLVVVLDDAVEDVVETVEVPVVEVDDAVDEVADVDVKVEDELGLEVVLMLALVELVILVAVLAVLLVKVLLQLGLSPVPAVHVRTTISSVTSMD